MTFDFYGPQNPFARYAAGDSPKEREAQATTDGTDLVFRDPAEKDPLAQVWRLSYAGQIHPATWNSKGAAAIHLERCQAAGRLLP